MASFWDDAAGVLSRVAPMLATAVGGPLAGAATSAIVSALGLSSDATPQAAAAAVVGATPEQLIALKAADQAFAEQMAKLDLDRDSLVFTDRASARAREMTVKDHAPLAIAGSVTCGFFALLALMAFRVMPAGNETILNIMLGSLGTGWTMVLSYYFGASSTQVVAAKK